MKTQVPTWFFQLGVVMALLALVPLAWVARARVTRSPLPRAHVVPDMDQAISYKRQEANAQFADGRAMRLPVEGTVARGMLNDDDHLYRGIVGGAWATDFPTPVDMAFLERGRERYEIFCSPCHGLSGYGNGTVAQRADELLQPTWVPPSSLHDDLVNSREHGHLFNTITNGIRTMPSYSSAIPTEDRWAIVAYVRALQRSQRATLADASADGRAELGQ